MGVISLFIHSKLAFRACCWKSLVLPQSLKLPSFSYITISKREDLNCQLENLKDLCFHLILPFFYVTKMNNRYRLTCSKSIHLEIFYGIYTGPASLYIGILVCNYLPIMCVTLSLIMLCITVMWVSIPVIWPSKSRTTISNIHTEAM